MISISSQRVRHTHVRIWGQRKRLQFSTCNSDLTPSLSEQTASDSYNSNSAVWHPENTPGGYAVSGWRWRLHVVVNERAAHRSKCERRTNKIGRIFVTAGCHTLAGRVRIIRCWSNVWILLNHEHRWARRLWMEKYPFAIFLAAKISSTANWISLIEHYHMNSSNLICYHSLSK